VTPSYRAGLDFHRAGRLSEAETIYRQILEADPRQFEARTLLGLIMSQRGRHHEAIEHLDLALAVNSRVAITHSTRAIALLALRQYEEALHSLDCAIELTPCDAGAHINRGVALKELGRTDEAVASYERAIAIDPSAEEAFNNRGIALLDGPPRRRFGKF
jgi:tetratricopeptide (TPR) repeat protein